MDNKTTDKIQICSLTFSNLENLFKKKTFAEQSPHKVEIAYVEEAKNLFENTLAGSLFFKATGVFNFPNLESMYFLPTISEIFKENKDKLSELFVEKHYDELFENSDSIKILSTVFYWITYLEKRIQKKEEMGKIPVDSLISLFSLIRKEYEKK
ncbi:hypothetical protein KJ991_02590 [Patescibacteria group bacterium]|nr:hypothetical protein [Patescibacteria group bacterium]MBU4115803.1 hypothetical protein [Patescibacteria group bacterium]